MAHLQTRHHGTSSLAEMHNDDDRWWCVYLASILRSILLATICKLSLYIVPRD